MIGLGVAVVAIACLALAACSPQRPALADVDLNAAAMEAQSDIANYQASRVHHPAPIRRAAGMAIVR